MDQKSANVQKIDEYISNLDKGQQRKERFTYLFYIPLVLLLLLLTGFMGYYFFFSESSPESPAATSTQVPLKNFEELNLTAVRKHFQDQEGVLLVQLPETEEVIALNSEQAYWELVDQMALRFINEDDLPQENSSLGSTEGMTPLESSQVDTLDLIEPGKALDFQAIASQTSLIARGTKRAGNPLIFTINNFQPELSYKIDFGNGVGRSELGSQFSYTYRRRGRFTAHLYGYFEGEEVFKKSIFLAIRNKVSKPPVKSETVVAEVEPQKEEEPEEKIEDANIDVFEVSAPATPTGSEEEILTESIAEDSGTPEPSAEVLPMEEEETPVVEMKERGETEEPSAVGTSETSASVSPLMVASQMPSFPSGEANMLGFLNDRLQYPQAARDYHIEGIVYVQFVVQPDGSRTDYKVLKGLGYGCNEEALRITRLMPTWIAGQQNGRKVPVLVTLPINFQLIK